ncbi:hypothetical protein HDU76_002647 [Blyttiomyces sp. JEL0837]|nr:hypothetical protein HDU76_002647 [Blyttiomyces sp. JEL0837]
MSKQIILEEEYVAFHSQSNAHANFNYYPILCEINYRFDESYEPTEEEILEYAKFLGMDPDEDKHLFWIARESLKAPLPPNWKPCQTEDGNIYYFNFSTGESIWDHPCDEHYRKLFEREKTKSKSEGGSTKKLDASSKPGLDASNDKEKSSEAIAPKTKPAPLHLPDTMKKPGALASLSSPKPTSINDTISSIFSKPALLEKAPLASPGTEKKNLTTALLTTDHSSIKDKDADGDAGGAGKFSLVPSISSSRKGSNSSAVLPGISRGSDPLSRVLNRIDDDDQFDDDNEEDDGDDEDEDEEAEDDMVSNGRGAGGSTSSFGSRRRRDGDEVSLLGRRREAVIAGSESSDAELSDRAGLLRIKSTSGSAVGGSRLGKGGETEEHVLDDLIAKVKSKYEEKLAVVERDEQSKFIQRSREIRENCEKQLKELESLEKDEVTRRIELDNKISQMQKEEKEKFDREVAIIKSKNETKLNQIKREEDEAFNTAVAKLKADNNKKLEEKKREDAFELEEMKAKANSALEKSRAEARDKEEAERVQLRAENDRRLQNVRKDVEAEFKRAEATLRENMDAELDNFRAARLKELEEKKKKVREEYDKMFAQLEKENARRIEELRAKYSTEVMDDERKVIEDMEENIKERRKKAEENRIEVARLEREVESIRKRVEEEKEALLEIERAVTDNMVAAKQQARLAMEQAATEAAEHSPAKEGSVKSSDKIPSRELQSTVAGADKEKRDNDTMSLHELDHSGLFLNSQVAPSHRTDATPQSRIVSGLVGAAKHRRPQLDLSDSESSASEQGDMQNPASPQALLKLQLKREEKQIRRAKRFLRRQRKDITVQQRSISNLFEADTSAANLLSEKFLVKQRDLEARLSALLHSESREYTTSPTHAYSTLDTMRRSGTVQDLETQLSSMLGLSRKPTDHIKGRPVSPDYTKRYIRSSFESREGRHDYNEVPKPWNSANSMYQPTRSANVYHPHIDTNSKIRADSPTRSVDLQHSPSSLMVSAKKVAWEASHVRSEAQLKEHRAWLEKQSQRRTEREREEGPFTPTCGEEGPFNSPAGIP